jgi:hypothetical protein
MVLFWQLVAQRGAIGQHDSPLVPHCWHAPATHLVTRVSQQAPVHALPAQQGVPAAPHAVHVPPTHNCPLLHVLPAQQA